MKLKLGIGALLASTVLVAGCTTDKDEIKDYNEKIQQAFDKEKPVSSVGKKLNDLEQEKQKLVEEINGKDQQETKETSQKIVGNVKDRQEAFEKEEQALDNSEKEFKKEKKNKKQKKHLKK